MEESLGERIRRLRESNHLSQEEFGALFRVSKKTVGNWENGRSVPRNKLGAIEAHYGVDLATGGSRDPVEAAIEHSNLDRSQRAELLAHYWRLLDHADETG